MEETERMTITDVLCKDDSYGASEYIDYPCGTDHKIIQANLDGMVFHAHNMVHIMDVFQMFYYRFKKFDYGINGLINNMRKCLKQNTENKVPCDGKEEKCSEFYIDTYLNSFKEYLQFIRIFFVENGIDYYISALYVNDYLDRFSSETNENSNFDIYIEWYDAKHSKNDEEENSVNEYLNKYIDSIENYVNTNRTEIIQELECFQIFFDSENKLKSDEELKNIIKTNTRFMESIITNKIQELFSYLYCKNFIFKSIMRKSCNFERKIRDLFKINGSYLVFLSEFYDTNTPHHQNIKSKKGFKYTHENNYIGDFNITGEDDFKKVFKEVLNKFDDSKFAHPYTQQLSAKGKKTDYYCFLSECMIYYSPEKLTELDYKEILDEPNSIKASKDDKSNDDNCTLYCSLFKIISSDEYIFAISLKFKNGALNGVSQYYYFSDLTKNRLYITLDKLKREYISKTSTLYVLIGGDFNNMYYAKSRVKFEGTPSKAPPKTLPLGKACCEWEMSNWCKYERSNIHTEIETTVTEILSEKIDLETHSIEPYTHEHNGQDIMKIFGWKISKIPQSEPQTQPLEGGYYDKYIKYKTKYLQLKNLSGSI